MSEFDVMIGQYVKLRDYKKEAVEQFSVALERVNEGMALLEGRILQALNESGGNSISTDNGTAYKREELSVTVKDAAAYLQYCRDNEEWDALDIKANKTTIKKYLDEQRDLPPGVETSIIAKVGVRRPTK